jgi:hypothetical protein
MGKEVMGDGGADEITVEISVPGQSSRGSVVFLLGGAVVTL